MKLFLQHATFAKVSLQLLRRLSRWRSPGMKQIWSRPPLEDVILHRHRAAKDNSKLMAKQNHPIT